MVEAVLAGFEGAGGVLELAIGADGCEGVLGADDSVARELDGDGVGAGAGGDFDEGLGGGAVGGEDDVGGGSGDEER